MANTKITKLNVKTAKREEMLNTRAETVLKNKELLVEVEGEDDTFTARFKIGDGITPYNKLPYISSLYKLLPNFILYNSDYSYGIDINLKNIQTKE